jgi:hypothetical protein
MQASKPFISVKFAKCLSQVKSLRKKYRSENTLCCKISLFALCVNIAHLKVVVKQKWVNATELLLMLTQSACSVLYSLWLNFRLTVDCR